MLANIEIKSGYEVVRGSITMREPGRFDLPLPPHVMDRVVAELEASGVLEFLRVLCPQGRFRTQNVLLSRPGSTQQKVHTDSAWSESVAAENPAPHYITVLVPLTKQTAETGGTRVWPGSHRSFNYTILNDPTKYVDTVSPLVEVGDALVFDGLLSHCGMANRSHEDRFFFYSSFSKGHDPNVDVTGV